MSNSYFHFLLLFLSLFGWGMLSHHKLKINPAFIPIFIFSSITSTVFLAGLLNFMPYMVKLIYYAGLLLFLLYIYLIFKKKYEVQSFFVPATIFFVVFSVYMTLLLKGLILLHYDNFSHWGLIVKEMFRINGLPDGTTIVRFRNYLPGSAVFIYFVGKIIGPDESHMLMAQSYLLGANLSALFVLSKWKKPAVILLNIVISVILLVVIPNNLYDLLVDTLLGVTALAATVAAYYYRKDWLRNIIVSTPLLLLLLLVKDSGKVFLFINAILIIWFIYANNVKGHLQKDGKRLLYGLVCLIVTPLFVNFLWVKYIEKAYPGFNYAENKFAVRSGLLNSIPKSEHFLTDFTPKFMHASLEPKVLITLNGLAILIMIFQFLKTKRISRQLIFATLFSNIVYAIYVFFCYLMFVYMMPEAEAKVLAGYYRYISTMIIYFAGIMMLGIVNEWAKSLNWNRFLSIFSFILILAVFIYPFNSFATLHAKPVTNPSERLQEKTEYEKVTGSAYESGIANPKVLYYSPATENDYGYLPYMLSYEYLSWDHFVILYHSSTKEDQKKLLDSMKKMDYLVVMNSDKAFNKFFFEKFGIEKPLGAFKINHKKNGIDLIPLQ